MKQSAWTFVQLYLDLVDPRSGVPSILCTLIFGTFYHLNNFIMFHRWKTLSMYHLISVLLIYIPIMQYSLLKLRLRGPLHSHYVSGILQILGRVSVMRGEIFISQKQYFTIWIENFDYWRVLSKIRARSFPEVPSVKNASNCWMDYFRNFLHWLFLNKDRENTFRNFICHINLIP